MIAVSNLSKSYGPRRAISDVSFTVRQGEVVGFLGPNGAGKTTTMKILTGFMAASAGKALIGGEDIFESPIAAKKKIGYLPEAPPLYEDMHVEDYLRHAARLKLCDSKKIPALAEKAMEKTGLTKVRRRLIQNLSKGFKQRAGLAQALVSDPEILILDEPTVGLDPNQVLEMRGLLAELRGRHTIILSTHILSEAQVSCERVIIISEGRIAAEDSLEGLSQKLKGRERRLFARARKTQGLAARLQSLEGVVAAREKEGGVELDAAARGNINEEIAKAIISGGFGLMEIKERPLGLEDVFVRLTASAGAAVEKSPPSSGGEGA